MALQTQSTTNGDTNFQDSEEFLPSIEEKTFNRRQSYPVSDQLENKMLKMMEGMHELLEKILISQEFIMDKQTKTVRDKNAPHNEMRQPDQDGQASKDEKIDIPMAQQTVAEDLVAEQNEAKPTERNEETRSLNNSNPSLKIRINSYSGSKNDNLDDWIDQVWSVQVAYGMTEQALVKYAMAHTNATARTFLKDKPVPTTMEDLKTLLSKKFDPYWRDRKMENLIKKKQQEQEKCIQCAVNRWR